jgi:PPK2 family polyphosphate:nucleotide phosphotransferase
MAGTSTSKGKGTTKAKTTATAKTAAKTKVPSQTKSKGPSPRKVSATVSAKDPRKVRAAARAKVADAVAATAEATALAKDAKRAKELASATVKEAVRASEVAATVEAGHTASASKPAKGLRDTLRVDPGFRLERVDPRATPGFDGGKKKGEKALRKGADELSELQERLFAQGRRGDRRSLLLVLQGMDTSGKGGIVRHVLGAVDPQGVTLTAFKAPTAAERAKGFLWRIRQALPDAGHIGVFDRSHYEDVLIVRVRGLAPRATWQRRYATINAFEKSLVDKGTTVVKVMLHISSDEQRDRLAARLERPEKHWKYNPHDVDERLLWSDYAEAYQVALTRTSTQAAPWYVVPADHKWYARWAVQQLLLDHLAAIDPQWPAADFEVEAEKARLADS